MKKDNQNHLNSSEAEKKLRSAFEHLVSKKKQVVFLRAFFILSIGLITAILLEQVFYLEAGTKITFSLLLVFAAAFLIWLHYRADTAQNFTDFYRNFSRKSGLHELKDILDLEKAGRGNRALINAAIMQNLKQVETSRLDSAIREHQLNSEVHQRYKKSLFLSLIAVSVCIVTAFNFSDAFHRAIDIRQSYKMPNPYVYFVEPGSVTMEQGSIFQAELKFSGAIPEDVSLFVKTAVEDEFREIGLNKNDSSYQNIPFDLNSNLDYYIQMDDFKSEIYTAKVQLRPRFSSLNATVLPPIYTHLDSSEYQYPFSQIRAYKGSEIKISGTVNKKLDSLLFASADSEKRITVNSDSTFQFVLDVHSPDTIHFKMADQTGLTNKNPYQLIIEAQEDEYPVVEILEPHQSVEMVNPKNLDVLFRASDDFQLTGASFHFELKRAFVEDAVSGQITLDKPENGALQPFNWALDSLNLKPQDVLSFWIEVQDNDGYSGYKSSSSEVLTLTIPSLVDYFEDLDEKEDDVVNELDEVSESFKQMREQYERFKEKMKESPDEVGYEQAQELEQVKNQHEEVQKKIEELNKKFEQIKEEINENNVLSEETQRAYEELQQLMQEIDDPAFLEALQKMREQLSQLSPEQLREAMEKLEFNEELYRQRLERTIELFKQLKLHSDLEKLEKSYEDLARREEEIQNGALSEEESALQREQTLQENEKLKQRVDSLSNNTSEKNEKTIQDYQQDAKQKLENLSREIQDALNEAQDQENEEGEQKDSDSKNQNFQQEYQQLAQQTRNLMEGMQREQTQLNVAGLRYILQSLLTLSDEQEMLSTLSSSTESRSQAFVDFARTQQNVENIFASLSDSLFKLSTESPQFSNQINEKKLQVERQLDLALKQLAERSQNQSSIATRQALGGINEMAFMLANLLEQIQNAQSSGGGGGSGSMEQMMEQLQQSGEQQRQLNEQIQNLINDIQGERLTQDQMERLNEIAKTQNRIRKQIQELQRNGVSGDKIGSELERMIEQMEETINDLRGGSIDPTLVERQQNILSRMLEAEKALQKRDEEEKREGNSAEQFDQTRPPELTLEELEKQIMKRLNDSNFTKYSDDYQRLIEKYFELLQEIQ